MIDHISDQTIIQGLIARDNRLTEDFFFVKCRPLFKSIMKLVFSYEVDYDEMVNELYVYLMEDDAVKLRNFQYRCSVYQWLKVLAIRFFIKKRNRMIDDNSKEPLSIGNLQVISNEGLTASVDIEQLFCNMSNKRYINVIRKLVLEDCEPDDLAHEMNITTANLYNIKRRAMAQLILVAIKDIREYGK